MMLNAWFTAIQHHATLYQKGVPMSNSESCALFTVCTTTTSCAKTEKRA